MVSLNFPAPFFDRHSTDLSHESAVVDDKRSRLVLQSHADSASRRVHNQTPGSLVHLEPQSDTSVLAALAVVAAFPNVNVRVAEIVPEFNERPAAQIPG